MTASTAIGVHVRLFAIQREQAGARRVDLELAPGSSIEGAWGALVARYPVLAAGRGSVRFARNGEYAEPVDRLEDGDELAIIPPVSGGAGAGEAGGESVRRILELREDPFGDDIVAVLSARLATPGDGAVVAFIGRTRETPGTPAPGQEDEAARHSGRSVDSLEYEAHESMVVRILESIADEIAERFGVERLAIVHRTGEVPLGEASVCIVACAAHRDAAFEAARYAIDETKARAPIWKAERFADGHLWIGEPARTEARHK
jgi:MoaE-MoaD fusion protein